MNFSERVKAIRAEVGLNQNEFANSLGMTRDSYANFEYDRIKNQNVKNPTIKAICEKYRINEQWLRTGEGDMHLAKTRAVEIAEITANMFKADDTDYAYQLTRILNNVDNKDLESLFNMARQWVDAILAAEAENAKKQ